MKIKIRSVNDRVTMVGIRRMISIPGPKNKYNVYDVLLSIKHGRRRGGNSQILRVG